MVVELSEKLNVPQNKCKEAFDAMIEEIICALEEGSQYNQKGFGTFRTELSKEHTGFNPATGKKMVYPKKLKIRFRLSSVFKKDLNE